MKRSLDSIRFLLLFICVLLIIQTVWIIYSEIIHEKSVSINQDNRKGVPAIKSLPDLPKANIRFLKTSHDFGIIGDRNKVYTEFKFENNSKEPLVILSAEGSCGCTIPVWPKDAILPGKSGKIEIAFDPNGQTGEHSKLVTITSNTEPATYILTIKATIHKGE